MEMEKLVSVEVEKRIQMIVLILEKKKSKKTTMQMDDVQLGRRRNEWRTYIRLFYIKLNLRFYCVSRYKPQGNSEKMLPNDFALIATSRAPSGVRLLDTRSSALATLLRLFCRQRPVTGLQHIDSFTIGKQAEPDQTLIVQTRHYKVAQGKGRSSQ
ncbi:hypothetical protein Leryth_024761 [Lithospermum erythrorhizon]|nr:hypothetical protein Leryth_024761 [Lithospermum erythrorhizon]